jgi:hypothetical protein
LRGGSYLYGRRVCDEVKKMSLKFVIKSASSRHIVLFNEARQELLLAKKATEEFLD